MDIIEFFGQSAGKWFSQRTSQDLANGISAAGTTDLWIETLFGDDPQVSKLCEQYKVDPKAAKCGVRVRWEGMPVINQPKQKGSTVLVVIGDRDLPHSGKLLRQTSAGEKTPVAANYAIGSDGVLTIITESETIYAEERLWFASPNLRLRTSIVNQSDGNSCASFCTEIRMGGSPPPQPIAAESQSAEV